MSSKWQKSWISLIKNRTVKLLHLTADDVLSRLKLLNAVTALTLPVVFPVRFYSQKNLCPRSHSGFEPESPVHISTWTWNAGNNMALSNVYWYKCKCTKFYQVIRNINKTWKVLKKEAFVTVIITSSVYVCNCVIGIPGWPIVSWPKYGPRTIPIF